MLFDARSYMYPHGFSSALVFLPFIPCPLLPQFSFFLLALIRSEFSPTGLSRVDSNLQTRYFMISFTASSQPTNALYFRHCITLWHLELLGSPHVLISVPCPPPLRVPELTTLARFFFQTPPCQSLIPPPPPISRYFHSFPSKNSALLYLSQNSLSRPSYR